MWILTIMLFGNGGNSVAVTTQTYNSYVACQAAANSNKEAFNTGQYGRIVQTCTLKERT